MWLKALIFFWEEDVDEINEKQIVNIQEKKSCHDQF